MRCLIVVKNRKELQEYEKSLKTKIEEICSVDVSDVPEMYAEQVLYRNTDYKAIILFLGDGTVLKTLSICTAIKNYFETAEYICMDRRVPMVKGEIQRNSVVSKDRHYTPMIFSFDHGTRGRLCNIKEKMTKEGENTLQNLITAICMGDFEEIDRLYRDCTIKRRRLLLNQSVYALNEIYIYQREKGLLGALSISIDSQLTHQAVRCDGVIISTPTGSSGYNASANGPILHGGVEGIVITFVCPADKKTPSFVVSSDCTITVKSPCGIVPLNGVVDGCLHIKDSEFIINMKKSGDVYFADVSYNKMHSDFMEAIKE
ncbi:hypothetical protein NERG_02010 [Nematocida ausubeli]|uniref:NAD+ kinase n=1 Tax=Nematocida ausubeli (strain ATCC PRA-371 / ERTm2) TaxID=1913371 RepID=H8ZEI9_NEMA1|nr:hypothetical protein NERG_02010 [Nematocida ausubeli]